MRIPFISELISARRESNNLIKQQIELQKKQLEVRQDAMKSIMAMTTIDRTLSDELYGNVGSQYKIGSWKLPISQMRTMSRIAYWDSSFAGSIIDRHVQITVGKGLTLESQPAWGMIPGVVSPEERKAKTDLIVTRFNIWAKSKKVHYEQEFNLDKLVNLAFFYYLYDGEFFTIFRYAGNGRGRNPLTIQFVAPENIKATSSENKKAAGNKIYDGIEYDSAGIAVALHVYDPETGNSTRIPKYGPRSGRQFWYHNYNKRNVRQRRGVPLLAGDISEIIQLADYQNLELQAAKINAMFAIWVEPPENSDGRETISAGARKKSVQSADPQTGEIYTSKVEEIGLSTGGIIVDKLPAGHKPHSFDTARPNVNFDPFSKSVQRNISSRSGMALSLVNYNYAQQYSAARGENIIQWMEVEEKRENVPADFLNVIFKMWLWWEDESGKISLPGFSSDEEIRDAWCNAFWKGASLPDIDPEKSMKAHKMEIHEAIKSRQSVVTQRGGGNVDENIARLQSENDALAEANRKIMEVEKTTYNISKSETKSESVSRTDG